jgi:hypothetical protein
MALRRPAPGQARPGALSRLGPRSSASPVAGNKYADPLLLRHFPDLQRAGTRGRGWWHDAAPFLALSRDNVIPG